jgi:predicted O-methyltransferase YrrM
MTCDAHALARSRAVLVEEDVDLIRDLVRSLADRTAIMVVDLGAGSGTTAAAVFAERPADVTVVTVDVDKQAIQWASRFIENIGVLDRWRGVQGDAAAMGRAWPASVPVDLVLLDASHEYEQTVAEIAAWRDVLRFGSPMWLHDYVGYEGVRQAVDEAVARGDLRVIEQRGLGIAVKT